MMWVVIGHSYGNYTLMGIVNITNVTHIVKQPFFLLLLDGPLSVDVFFMLAGFFLAFIMLASRPTASSTCWPSPSVPSGSGRPTSCA